MWPAAGTGREGQPDGTFYFNNQPNMLDQFLINKNMAAHLAGQRPRGYRRDPPVPGDDRRRRLPQAGPVRGMGDPVNQDGFSDHFPIGLSVVEAD
jgi:hypothetical protein